MITISSLMDEKRCYEEIRKLRWPGHLSCPHCDSESIIKKGSNDHHPNRQRYQCQACHKRFDDLTASVFSGHHQPLSVWVLCLYFMGLNLSNSQIAKELDLNQSDLQFMTTSLRSYLDKKKPADTGNRC